MATPAHELIQTVNITSGVSQVTFNNIGQGWRDLQLIIHNSSSTVSNGYYRLNNDSSFNYDVQLVEGDGSTIRGRYNTSAERAYLSFETNVWGDPAMGILDLMDYSKTDRYKFGLSRVGNASRATNMAHNMYKSNSAITRLDVYISFAAGSNLSLYGILSEAA